MITKDSKGDTKKKKKGLQKYTKIFKSMKIYIE